MLIAKGIIGRCIKKNVKNVPPKYTTREALFKDPPPPKEDCPICFSLRRFTSTCNYLWKQKNITPVVERGKSICRGCVDSFCKSLDIGTCLFCKSMRMGKTEEQFFDELMKRVDVNDAGAMYVLANDYRNGNEGLNQDQEKAEELCTKQAAELGSSQAHYHLGTQYDAEWNSKKSKIH